jgi:hypothetical protein
MAFSSFTEFGESFIGDPAVEDPADEIVLFDGVVGVGKNLRIDEPLMHERQCTSEDLGGGTGLGSSDSSLRRASPVRCDTLWMPTKRALCA